MANPEALLQDLIDQEATDIRALIDQAQSDEVAASVVAEQGATLEDEARAVAIDERRLTLEMAKIVSERMNFVDIGLHPTILQGYSFDKLGRVKLPRLKSVQTEHDTSQTTEERPPVREWPFFGWTTIDSRKYGGYSTKSESHQFYLRRDGSIARYNHGGRKILSEDPLSTHNGQPVWLKHFQNPAKVDFSSYWGSHALNYRDYNQSENETRMRVALAHLAAVGDVLTA